jgi:colanic acid/amylovoran biosynthesis glycosyltransferase
MYLSSELGLKHILCIFDSQLGAPFVDLHIKGILPGQTVAISRAGGHPLAPHFEPPCPAMYLDRWSLRLSIRLLARFGIARERLLARAVERFMRTHGVTAVLGEYLDQFLDFVPIVERAGLPYVVQGHGVDVSASLRKLGMAERYQVYRSARAILTRSEFHRRRLIELGLPANLIHVSPGGVLIPATPPLREPGAYNRILAIGRMVPQKAPILLLEAFRLAAARDPDLRLDYVGAGPLYSTVWQFVEARGLSGRVRLHGLAPESTKQRLMQQCGVFAQHSALDPETGDEEGLPSSIQEAMAHGLAVVSTRHTGIAEAVVENKTGLLVDEGDVEGMAEAFLRIRDVAKEFGAAGHRRAAALYSWQDENTRLRRWLFDASV